MKGFFRRLFKRRTDKNTAPRAARRDAAHGATGRHRVPPRSADARSPQDDALDWVVNDDPKAKSDHFDPYNTGSFDRGTSWDKISRQRKR